MAGAAAGNCVFPASHDALRFAIPRLAPQCLADEDRRSLARLPSCESGDAVGSDNVAEVNNLAVFFACPDAAIGWYRLDGNSPPSGEKISCRRNGGKAQLRIPHRS